MPGEIGGRSSVVIRVASAVLGAVVAEYSAIIADSRLRAANELGVTRTVNSANIQAAEQIR